MHFDTQLFLRALGLAIVLESLCWVIAPGAMHRMMQTLLSLPEQQLRFAGLTALIFGMLLMTLTNA
ncbi:MAG: DUF2065 domain-containing protein [Desulfovibrio sp.]|nr:DUF2065 domain-containing protein [Desulfovibrio sp.]